MKKSDKKIKRKIGVLGVLGILILISLIPISYAAPIWGGPDAEDDDSYYISIDDDGDPDDDQAFAVSKHGKPGVGTELLRLEETGRLGIGDTSPDFKLEVTGSSGSGYFGVTTSSDGDRFIIDTNGRVGIGTATPGSALEIKTGYYTSATSALHVKNSQDTSLFFVRDDGNVGIGVIDPAEKLEIDGNILFNFGTAREIKIEDPPHQYSNGNDLTVRAGNAYWDMFTVLDFHGGNLYLYGGDGEGVQSAHGGDVYIYGGTAESMWPHDGDVILAYTGMMPRGNVGIGTASPNEKLDVAGKIRASDGFNHNGADGISQIITFEDNYGGTHTLTFSGGILTGYTPP